MGQMVDGKEVPRHKVRIADGDETKVEVRYRLHADVKVDNRVGPSVDMEGTAFAMVMVAVCPIPIEKRTPTQNVEVNTQIIASEESLANLLMGLANGVADELGEEAAMKTLGYALTKLATGVDPSQAIAHVCIFMSRVFAMDEVSIASVATLLAQAVKRKEGGHASTQAPPPGNTKLNRVLQQS